MGKKTRKRRGTKKKGGARCAVCGLDKQAMMASFKREITLLNNAMLSLQAEVVRLNEENTNLRSKIGGRAKKTKKRRRRQRGRG
jgi:hypothetical protein